MVPFGWAVWVVRSASRDKGLTHLYDRMVEPTEKDGMTWYECEHCGLLLDDREEAAQHEQSCDAEEPSYLQ